MSERSGTTKIITDEPTLDDALDFRSYSQQLASIIINSTPRFTIGIFGGWGTGKTTLMKMIQKSLKDNNRDNILVVWFDAWKYEKEKYLAIVPFIRTIKIALENDISFKSGRWNKVREGLEHTFTAFINSTNINLGLSNYVSTQIYLSKFIDVLKADVVINGEHISYHGHVTDYLMYALSDLRNPEKGGNRNSRIVAFIDDLDRCSPENALELLESIKTFFDIEGIVYVIGMDSDSINSIVKKKYGDDFSKGLDYMQKIVQLPFQIPTWKEVDVSRSINKIISKGLEGSDLANQFENSKELIVKAVQLNLREVKRFINNIILAKLVLGKPVDELIAVQALNYRRDWRNFLDLITSDKKREVFLNEYKKLKQEGKDITNEEELVKFTKELSEANNPWSGDIVEIFQELLKQGKKDLRKFLDAKGGENQPPVYEILLRIQKMEEHRRGLDTAKLNLANEGEQISAGGDNPSRVLGDTKIVRMITKKQEEGTKLKKLLNEGKIQEFNEMRVKLDISNPELVEADLKDANLTHADLSGANLVGANLTHADLSFTNLTHADLSGADSRASPPSFTMPTGEAVKLIPFGPANLSYANLSYANFSNVNLSDVELRSSILIGCRGHSNGMKCHNANFVDAIIDDEKLSDYLGSNGAKNVPKAVKSKNELQKRLEAKGLGKDLIERLLLYCSLP